MKRFVGYFLAALAIGAFFLYLAARELPWEAVGDWLATEDLWHVAGWSLAFTSLYATTHFARVVRWYFLVRPLDATLKPSDVHKVCAVGLTAILLLPLRLGEFVRPYLLSKRSSLSMSSVLGTAVVERVVDGLLVTGLLFVTLSTLPVGENAGFARAAGLVSAAVFVPALVVTLLALWRRELAVRLVRRLAGTVSESLAEKLAGLLDSFIVGFRALVSGRSVAPFLALTAFYWGLNVFGMWMLARGFGLELSLWEMAAVLSVLVIGIMIPAGPAGAGNFEYFALRGLGLFLLLEGTQGVAAGAFAALLHILQFLVILVPGLVVMASDEESRHLVRLSTEADQATHEGSAP